MKKNLLIICLILLGLNNKAQVLNNTWYFSSTSKGLYFDPSNNSVSITNEHSPMPGSGGYGVATDSITGNVLFYSNGCSIWDKSHQIMPNGSGLLGDSATIQNGLVCYYPNHPNKYFVISNNGEAPNTGHGYYSIVDMSLNGNGDSLNPKGNVVSGFKNISFVDSTSEGMMIIQGNNNNFWLIVPRINSNDIRIFSITENGINLYSTHTLNTFLRYPECIRYSESTGRIAFASMQESDPIVIANFSINTGEISNESTIPGTPFGTSTTCWHGVFDMDWSFDGSKLYLSKYRDSSPVTSGKIYQYDLNNPSNNPVVVYSIPSTQFAYSLRGMKRGPDNKIYFIYINTQYANTRYIGVINNPDLQATACNVNPTALDMGISLNNTHKLPEFLLPLHISTVVPIDTFATTISSTNVTCNSLCNASATITATGGTSPYLYLWSTGNTSTSLTNLCAGNYTVTVIDATSDTLIQQVIITEPSALILNVGDIQGTGCNGENSGSATVIASGGVSPYSFLWDNAPGVNTSTASNLSAGSYNVVVVDSFSCNATLNLIVPAAAFGTITGTVQFSIGYVGAGDGVVHLYKANVPGFYEVDSSAIFSNGTFVLNQIPAGDYFLYVKMDNHSSNLDYNIIHNTYYDSTYKWFDATILTMACGDSLELIVNMYEKSTGNNYGNGNISGNIHYNSNNKAINGEPVPGAEITLEQEPDDAPIANSSSDITGFFEFTDIAEGNYSIYIDIPGLPHVSTYSVTVTSTDTVFTNLNFVVDTVSINPGIYKDSTVIVNYITTHYSISVFPNPFAENINVCYSFKNSSNVIFELIDIGGRVIESYNKKVDAGSYNHTFKELKTLENGIYVLKIVVDNTVYIKKLVKN